MVEYYDFVLGLIPLAFATISGSAFAGGASQPIAVGIGGAVAIALVLHALFVRTPGSATPPPRPTARPPNAD